MRTFLLLLTVVALTLPALAAPRPKRVHTHVVKKAVVRGKWLNKKRPKRLAPRGNPTYQPGTTNDANLIQHNP